MILKEVEGFTAGKDYKEGGVALYHTIARGFMTYVPMCYMNYNKVILAISMSIDVVYQKGRFGPVSGDG